jgi:acyl-CoA reductase-like NAD-dependent aldehyde dehydrogenase
MTARARVERLLRAAGALSDPGDPLGKRARAELPATTRLSPEGVALALAECLETQPTEAELEALLASVRPARRTLVLLPANVFVAAHRALALALASSDTVLVRPSRREPLFVELLAHSAPGLFDVVTELAPEPGDALWAYGGEETLAGVRSRLPEGVELHAQGPGHGVAVVGRESIGEATALSLARDIVPFDQRGCLSPRVLLVTAGPEDARRFAALLAKALAGLELEVPLGTLDAEERADAARFRDTAIYAGSPFPAGAGTVVVLSGAGRLLAPSGRNLSVLAVDDPLAWLAPVAADITALGLALPEQERQRLAKALPRARTSSLGAMQRPRFDGPADRRGP